MDLWLRHLEEMDAAKSPRPTRSGRVPAKTQSIDNARRRQWRSSARHIDYGSSAPGATSPYQRFEAHDPHGGTRSASAGSSTTKGTPHIRFGYESPEDDNDG